VVGQVAVLIICLLAIWAMACWLWLLFARGIAIGLSRKTQPYKFWVTAILCVMLGFVVCFTFVFVKRNF
jgi:hypothetical protein